ncbi:hypothetical protein CHUAL_004510 [Chamberlinius hualienensis]
MATAKKAKQASYVPPQMSFDNLVLGINEAFNVGIVKTDITNLEVEKLLGIYALFLEAFDIFDATQSLQPVAHYTLSQNSRGVDELDRMIVYSNIFSIIRTFIPVLDITFSDIIAPTVKRVQMILGHFLNLWRFCKKREEETESIMEICNDIAQKKCRFQNEAPTIERQINDIYSEICSRKNEHENTMKARDELSHRCVSALDTKKQIQNKIKVLKSMQNEIERSCEQKVKLDEELLQNIKSWEDQIIESPEKLDQIIEDVTTKTNKYKSDYTRAMKKLETTRKGIVNGSTWKNEISSLKVLIKLVESQRNDVIDTEDRIRKIEGEQLLEEIADTETQLKKVCEKESLLREKNNSIDHKHQLEAASLHASLNEAKRSLEKIRLSNSEKDKESREYLEEIESLTSIMAARRDEWEEFEIKAKEHADLLDNTVDKFHSEVKCRIQTMNESFAPFEKMLDCP